MANKGRKNAYFEKVYPNLEMVEGWAHDGVSEKDIAKNLGIAYSTLNAYKNKYPEFCECLKRGKDFTNYVAENRLYQKVTGFTKTVKKAMKVKVPVIENNIKIADKEEVVMVEEEIYYPPDLGAIVFWLKNRLPEKWQDKPERAFEEIQNSGVVVLPEVGTLKVEVERKEERAIRESPLQ